MVGFQIAALVPAPEGTGVDAETPGDLPAGDFPLLGLCGLLGQQLRKDGPECLLQFGSVTISTGAFRPILEKSISSP